MEACKKNNLIKILELITQGADVDFADAISMNRNILMDAVVDGRFLCTQLLSLNRANISATDAQGWTAVHYAAAKGDAICCAFLLKTAENKNLLSIADIRGFTPLDMAKQNGHSECLRVLQEHLTN